MAGMADTLCNIDEVFYGSYTEFLRVSLNLSRIRAPLIGGCAQIIIS